MEPRDRKRERRALGLSVLLHGFVAPLFVAVFVGVTDLRPEGREATSGLFSITVVHHAAPAPPRPAIAHIERERVSAPVFVPSQQQHPVITTASQRRPSGTPNKTHRMAVVQPVATPMPTPTHSATPHTASHPANTDAQVAVNTPGADPKAAAPAPAASTEAVADAPPGGWGQNFRDPVVLDEGALASLRARYRGVVAHVDVDEDGHAVRVSIDGSVDADARAEIERRLLATRFVPAECNGLRCAATLDLRV